MIFGDATWMEGSKSLGLAVLQSQGGKFFQSNQHWVSIVTLPDHGIMLETPASLSQESFEISAVVRIAKKQEGVVLDWLRL
jgi:hypothetical protein